MSDKTTVKINRMIVHHVSKTKNERKQELIVKNLRDELNPVDSLSQKLVDDLDKIYKKKTEKSYGQFKSEIGLDTFESLIKTYYDKKSDETFIDFTKKATDIFKITITGTAATGGFLFYIDYVDVLGNDQFAVFVLSEKQSCGLNKKTLLLEERLPLDIDHLNMAVLIHIKKWQDLSESYLSFAKGLKDITEYFTAFIGCGARHKSSAITIDVMKAVAKYCNDYKIPHTQERIIEIELHNYFERCREEKKEVTLTGISSRINLEAPDAFKNFLGDNVFSIPDSFEPDKRSYKSWVWISISNDLMKLDFSRKLIEDGIVYYSNDEKKVIIKDDDEKLRKIIFKDEKENN